MIRWRRWPAHGEERKGITYKCRATVLMIFGVGDVWCVVAAAFCNVNCDLEMHKTEALSELQQRNHVSAT
jgi:hypothetical protein